VSQYSNVSFLLIFLKTNTVVILLKEKIKTFRPQRRRSEWLLVVLVSLRIFFKKKRMEILVQPLKGKSFTFFLWFGAN